MQAGKPILLVEGPETDVPVAKRILNDLGIADCVFFCVATPEALTYLKTRTEPRPCVVLLDVDQVGDDGLATLRTIKADDQLRTIPVVVLGPSGDRRMVDESFGLGAAGYMVKSPDYAQVAATMRTLYEYWSLSELPK
jgi:CheY-like chemotaxis protein